ncbi:hypothetical protein QRO11_20570 [Paracidovorax citrulli]|uniref:hypothetical protein n=1 Tax=Paracidovorax citrulli TaxID=80869 RepID=UPI000890DFC7|nr:hypothetical protein [Paracidovorax citrulli]UEG45853.1 hypothetical protein LKW27_19755 [Paracidovorax citrulli]UMT86849.1 hypothetical protein FRC90_01520 [Paracidovorax citrulli]WIY34308.1 hypothetical protein QRO11_20570 [Paracidovorax citrulli]SDK28598.1 hypothetical protein SAMN04489709_11423 [Paracidovorax citrulli]
MGAIPQVSSHVGTALQEPAQQGLDRDAFDTLDAARQQAFRDYCAVRFGIADPHRCEKAIEDRRL